MNDVILALKTIWKTFLQLTGIQKLYTFLLVGFAIASVYLLMTSTYGVPAWLVAIIALTADILLLADIFFSKSMYSKQLQDILFVIATGLILFEAIKTGFMILLHFTIMILVYVIYMNFGFHDYENAEVKQNNLSE